MNANRISLNVERNGRRGVFELDFGEWSGDSIEIAFRDSLYRNRGVIELNGPTGSTRIRTEFPYEGDLSDGAVLQNHLSPVVNSFAHNFTFGWSPDAGDVVVYDENYHTANNYVAGNDVEIAIKKMQARVIRELATPSRMLVAGCSNGELIRRCREIGLDAHGFDVIPNLVQIAFPEVKEYMRVGSLTDIPFHREDGFDTLVAVNVLEHIPERDIPRMVEEWNRIGVTQLVLLINLNQFWFPGHITLRPIEWWASQWKESFRLKQTVGKLDHLPSLYSNQGQYNQQWTIWTRTPR